MGTIQSNVDYDDFGCHYCHDPQHLKWVDGDSPHPHEDTGGGHRYCCFPEEKMLERRRWPQPPRHSPPHPHCQRRRNKPDLQQNSFHEPEAMIFKFDKFKYLKEEKEEQAFGFAELSYIYFLTERLAD